MTTQISPPETPHHKALAALTGHDRAAYRVEHAHQIYAETRLLAAQKEAERSTRSGLVPRDDLRELLDPSHPTHGRARLALALEAREHAEVTVSRVDRLLTLLRPERPADVRDAAARMRPVYGELVVELALAIWSLGYWSVRELLGHEYVVPPAPSLGKVIHPEPLFGRTPPRPCQPIAVPGPGRIPAPAGAKEGA